MQLLIFNTLEPVRFLRPLFGYIALKKFVVEFDASNEKPSDGKIRLLEPGTLNIILDDKTGLIDTREIAFEEGDYSIDEFNSKFKFLKIEINKSGESISVPKNVILKFSAELVRALGLKGDTLTSKGLGTRKPISIEQPKSKTPKRVMLMCKNLDGDDTFFNGESTPFLATAAYQESIRIEPINLHYQAIKNEHEHELTFYVLDENNVEIKSVKSIQIELFYHK